MATRNFLTDQGKYADFIRHITQQLIYARQHKAKCLELLELHGDHGPLISGVWRDHFPNEAKEELRFLCFLMNESSNAAWDKRPKWSRNDTLRMIARQIATRDGCGFYGPQSDNR